MVLMRKFLSSFLQEWQNHIPTIDDYSNDERRRIILLSLFYHHSILNGKKTHGREDHVGDYMVLSSRLFSTVL